MADSAISSISAYKTAVFSEINPVPLSFCLLKILPMERSSDSQSQKKIIDQIVGYNSFYVKLRANLSHLFV